jgi:glutathionyl-hydroquinone reductase
LRVTCAKGPRSGQARLVEQLGGLALAQPEPDEMPGRLGIAAGDAGPHGLGDRRIGCQKDTHRERHEDGMRRVLRALLAVWLADLRQGEHTECATIARTMGMLVDGQWKDAWYDTKTTGGKFVRPETQFRQRVEATPGARFTPEAGRYRLYVSLACPWAHRTLILRALKGLEAVIPVSVVNPLMLEHGWTFDPGPGVIADPIFGARYAYEIYQRADPHYSGRVTVPILWDTREATIVSNESAEILRMLESAFDALATRQVPDLYPAAHRAEIDALNARVYSDVNNGVYAAGFATEQEPYERAVTTLFEALDMLDARLKGRTWLVGDTMTEADIRLFTTLVRFDAVYHGHFKCNLRRIVDYPQLWPYTRRIYQLPHVAETVSFAHIKEHYYRSHRMINPTGVVPRGPIIDWTA